MDKSWIDIENRVDPKYLRGVKDFIEFAYANKDHNSKIYCSCKRCGNRRYGSKADVATHIVEFGVLPHYKVWKSHGEFYSNVNENEDSCSADDMVGLVHDAFGAHIPDQNFTDYPRDESTSSGPDAKTEKFLKLLKEVEQKLYPDCDSFTTLSFIVQLLHIKVLNGWSDKLFDMLVEILKKSFPKGETFPKSYYEAKKLNEALGFTYKKIDACPRDCMLYWKDKEWLDKCDYCKTSRYIVRKGKSDNDPSIITTLPAKQVRYFPLKPRLRSCSCHPKQLL